PGRRIPAASRMAAIHSAAIVPGSPGTGPLPGPTGRHGATRLGTHFTCTVTGMLDGHVIIDGVIVRMVFGGSGASPASVIVPVTPGVHVITSVYTAVSPGSTVIVSPVPPDAGGGTVSVNPAPIPPSSDTVCCGPGDVALSVIVSVALSSVVTVGVNVTVIVQLESAPMPPSLALQLSLSL